MKNTLKRKAIILRKQGLSYNEIRRKIPVAKSTLSLWLHTVPLKPEHRQRLYTKRILYLARGPKSQKERRAKEVTAILERAKSEITLPLHPDAYKLLGTALYWAEGSKKKNFEITNSDPWLILFMVQWLKKVFNVDPAILKASLNMYPQQNEARLKRFWSQLTDIPIQNFRKSYIKPLNKKYKKNNLYYGTIKIYVPHGTDMKLRVFGWTQAILRDIRPRVTLIEKRWQSLREASRAVNL